MDNWIDGYDGTSLRIREKHKNTETTEKHRESQTNHGIPD